MIKETSEKQKAVDLIKKSKNILLLTHIHPDGDAVSSLAALRRILEKMGKKVEAVVSGGIPKEYEFLPNLEKIQKDIKAKRDLIISINPEGKIEKISYNKKENGVIDLIISPSEGEIKNENVTLSFGKLGYDLIIILDTPNIERIDNIYEENKDLLSKVAAINIDHHSTNKMFGTVNWVDSNSTSSCEMLVSLIEALSQSDNFAGIKNLMDSDIATLLLAGIISDTDRYQNANTTPKSMTVSAQLIAAGANRSEIIKNVFKTHPVSTLKLWGKILSNIKENKESGIVWSTLSKKEMEETGYEGNNNIEGVVNELLSTAPGAKLVLLLTERKGGEVTGSMRSSDEKVDLGELASLLFGGGGHKQAAGFMMENTSLASAEKNILYKIEEYLKGNINRQARKNLETPSNKKAGIIYEENKINFSSEKKNNEELYSPSISDIEQEIPKITDDESSILKKIIESKKEKSFQKNKNDEENIDFAKLEEELKAKRKSDDDWDDDEDYE